MFKWLFQPDKGDPYNKATEHYRRLRHLGDNPGLYNSTLVEIARHCQLAIRKNRFHGDAHVLLANAYFLAGPENAYCLPRAIAVIHEWRTNQRLYTKPENREIGNKVYEGIVEAIASLGGTHLPPQANMADMHRQFYSDAINIENLSNLQRELRLP